MFRTILFIASAAALLPAAAGGAAPVAEPMQALTAEGAQTVIDAAVAEAGRRHTTGTFAVVDPGGSLVALTRLDGTFPAAAAVATGKARTAALFRKPTRVFEEIIRNGRTPMVALDDFTPRSGGVPILVGGQVVGAIGVSGAASAAEDDELAEIGAASLGGASSAGLSPPPAEAVYVSSAEVSSAFARGAPLLENSAFKVHASRREKPGQAEVHAGETDIIYVLEGTATFVTGGTVVDPQATGEGEIRGPSISGGTSRSLEAGDLVIVPAGVPHWFRGVEGPFLYYVVKVR